MVERGKTQRFMTNTLIGRNGLYMEDSGLNARNANKFSEKHMANRKPNIRKIYKDFRFSDSDEQSTKHFLASRINCLIDSREMNDSAAADFLEMSASRIGKLRSGKLTNFSIERLYSLLRRLDSQVENRLLEEYRELGVCWRQDDDWISKWTAVLLPLSIAALTLPYLKASAPKLLAVTGGLALISYWYLSSLISKRRFEIRFSRIHEIERILGFDSHLRYHKRTESSSIKHQNLRRWMFRVYLLIALLLTCDIRVEATNPSFVHRTATLIRDLSSPRVEPTLWVFDVPPFVNLWSSSDPWNIKIVITAETLVFFVLALLVYRIGCHYYKKCNDVAYRKTKQRRWFFLPARPPKTSDAKSNK